MLRFEDFNKSFDRQNFDCNNQPINDYLRKMASQHDKKGIAKVHILTDDEHRLVGFYTLANISFDNTSQHIAGYPREIPAILIGRMGIHQAFQGKGLSQYLISHALQNIKKVSHISGFAFVVIDAKNQLLATYYEKLGFFRVNNSLTLVYPVKQIN